MVESLASMTAYLQAQADNSLASSINKGVGGFFEEYAKQDALLRKEAVEVKQKAEEEMRQHQFAEAIKPKDQASVIDSKFGTPTPAAPFVPPSQAKWQQLHPRYASLVDISNVAMPISYDPKTDSATVDSTGKVSIKKGEADKVKTETPSTQLDYDSVTGTYYLGGTKKKVDPNNYPKRDVRNLGKERDSTLDEVRTARLQGDLINKFNNDATIKKARGSLDAASMVRDLAESGNPIAQMSIPTYAARMAGEMGALTEADKAPFGGSQAFDARFTQALQKVAKGKLTPENVKLVSELSTIIEKRTRANMARTAKTFAKQYSKTGKFGTEKEIFDTFLPDYVEQPKNGSPAGSQNVVSGGSNTGKPQYKDGDTRSVDGVTLVRKNGKWTNQ